MHGRFAWYDLMTPDVAASQKFYPKVTGWSTEAWGKGDYVMWKAGQDAFAGMNPITPEQRAQGIPAHWLAYVNVDDVEGAANRVRALGGRVIHGPEEIPEVGRFAIIQDPQGATMAIFKGSGPWPGWDGTAASGKFSWHELMTTDYRSAFDFYRQLFGWELQQEENMGPAGMYLMYGKDGKMFGGMYNRPPELAMVPPSWTFYVNVKDVNKAAAATKKAGGKVTREPMDVPGGSKVAMMTDPQGAVFAVHQLPSEGGAKPRAKAKSAKRSAKASKSKSAKAGRKSARKAPAKRARKATAKRVRKATAKRARKATAKRVRKATAKRVRKTARTARRAARRAVRRGKARARRRGRR